MKVSQHITYKEAIYSNTAKRFGIDNTPNANQLYNMQMVAEFIFEPIRAHFNVPILISSMFRSKELNRLVGGSKTSQHLFDNDAGAIDIDDTYGGVTNLQIYKWIQENLEYDQLIAEYPDEYGNASWVHVSFKANGNRNQSFNIT